MWHHFRSYLETFLRIGNDVSITILVFKLFQKTSNDKNFQKQNKNIFGVILAAFARILEILKFPGRHGSVNF